MVQDLRPNFLVIGAMKAGTSSLHRYLGQHPALFTTSRKEPDFFIADRTADEQRRYTALFEPAPCGSLVGESSPNYTKLHLFPGTPRRIRAFVPDVRLIYLLRDPIQRMLSHYHHSRRRGRETRSFAKAVRESENLIMTSRYCWQLTHYLSEFPRRQVLVITTEDLDVAPVPTLSRVFRFLGVDDEVTVDVSERRNAAPEDGGLAPDPGLHQTVNGLQPIPNLQRELWEQLRDDVEQLRRLVEDDVGSRSLHRWGTSDLEK
jgi:hypothetical protein